MLHAICQFILKHPIITAVLMHYAASSYEGGRKDDDPSATQSR